MKYKLSILLALAGCASNSYTLKGDIKGFETDSVRLSYSDGVGVYSLGAAPCIDGVFEFSGSVDYPILVELSDNEGRGFTMFFLENSDITVSGSSKHMGDLVVKGSESNDLNDTLSNRSKGISNLDDYLSMTKDFIRENPASVVSAYNLDRSLARYMELDELKEYYAVLDSSLYSTFYAENLKQRITQLELSSVGQPFVDFSAPSFDGDTVLFSSIAGRGDWVLLNFWAGWNGASRRQIPAVKAIVEKYADKGLKTVLYSLDAVKEEWAQAIQYESLSGSDNEFIHLSELKVWESEAAFLYSVTTIPSNTLIAPDGTIKARNLSVEALETFLEENL